MPEPTAAAEPLDEPPGVREWSCGLHVPGHGDVAANSVVEVLPKMIAPASRNAWTDAESLPVLVPFQRAEPWPVGMSTVSMMSLMPMGMPSMAESGLPAFQRAVDSSAMRRAPSILSARNAPTIGSSPAIFSRQDSRYTRG